MPAFSLASSKHDRRPTTDMNRNNDGETIEDSTTRFTPATSASSLADSCSLLNDKQGQYNQSMCKSKKHVKEDETSVPQSNLNSQYSNDANGNSKGEGATNSTAALGVSSPNEKQVSKTRKSSASASGGKAKPKEGEQDGKQRTKGKKKKKQKLTMSGDREQLGGTDASKNKTLCDENAPEPVLSLRPPGKTRYAYRKELKVPEKKHRDSMPLAGGKRNEFLEDHPNHLPFYKHNHYERIRIIRQLGTIPELRNILHDGFYYIEKDWVDKIDPRLPVAEQERMKFKSEQLKKNFKTTGRHNRIATLFFTKIMNWLPVKEVSATTTAGKTGGLIVCFLGKHLARKAVFDLLAPKPLKNAFKQRVTNEKQNMFVINRLPDDIIFKDKEVLVQVLVKHMHSIDLKCTAVKRFDPNGVDCSDDPQSTRRLCPHQNISMSLKPCSVDSCFNYKKTVCQHLRTFIPETISIYDYSSMLTFVERFQSKEDLSGTIFVGKPAYLSNGRGIKFFTTVDQFKLFYHMNDGSGTSRHGVVLQRYVENPCLVSGKKFSLRFFLIILVLPKRRVIGFIHKGVVMVAQQPYEAIQRSEPEKSEKNQAFSTLGDVTTAEFKPEVHITNYLDAAIREKRKGEIRNGTASLLSDSEDHIYYFAQKFDPSSNNGKTIYDQMRFVGQCILQYLEPVIASYTGCYQLVSVDAVVDSRMKLWVTETGTKVFSSFSPIAPRQRQMMSAILQEYLGITIECFYKCHNDLPLYYDYEKKQVTTKGFYFAQDFEFFYETEFYHTDDYFMVQPPAFNEYIPLETRYDIVDQSRIATAQCKANDLERKKKLIAERKLVKAKSKLKPDEES